MKCPSYQLRSGVQILANSSGQVDRSDGFVASARENPTEDSTDVDFDVCKTESSNSVCQLDRQLK